MVRPFYVVTNNCRVDVDTSQTITAESCPHGDDPTTQGQVDEVQLLKCIATSGTFQLLYRTSRSYDVPFDATPSVLRDVLTSSFGFEDAIVEYSVGTTACSSVARVGTQQNVIKITFPIDHGNLPPLQVDTAYLTLAAQTPGTVAVAVDGAVIDGIASQMGTKEMVLCSNKGTCNYETGQCVCAAGYGSSDGRGNRGSRDDCGVILPTLRSSDT